MLFRLWVFFRGGLCFTFGLDYALWFGGFDLFYVCGVSEF